jgi:hypothetical protein
MCVQFFFSLKVKYPKNFSARVVSRYAWMDVTSVDFQLFSQPASPRERIPVLHRR